MHDELAQLKQRIADLERENESLNVQLTEYKGGKISAGQVKGSELIEATPINEADATLRRMIQRMAMILQAEKIVIMFHDRDRDELIGIPPALGVDEEHLKKFHVKATEGISGHVFQTGEPVIFHDAVSDERTVKDHVVWMGVHNGVTVPLVIEKRDEENRVIEKSIIGVLHAFNKRHNEDFIDEDVPLLERMAKNAGSIIANLQLYREVVEEREELLQTFESLAAGLILVSSDGRINQMNSSARAIFSLGPDAFGKMVSEAIPNQALNETLEMAHKNGDAPVAEIDLKIQGNDCIYQIQAARVMGEDNKELGVVAIMTDVTEMKNIERMKSSFVAMASHELRTPLTAIKGFSSTLLEGVDDDIYNKDDQKEFLGIVVHECDRLRRLIDDLLNTSRIEAGESLKPNYTENVPLRELLKKSQMVQQQATQKHDLRLEMDPSTPEFINADQDKLDQILTNLLNNAIKYAPNGGDITIISRLEGDQIKIGIKDQGLGIPADHVDKVFERFHRVNNEDNRKIYGTGLGLFLVKHLVEEVHMGKIWCESELGVGSTFWFTMPAHLDIEKAREHSD